MRLRFRIVCVGLFVTIGGCASNPGIVSIGEGTSVYARQQVTGHHGLADTRAEMIQAATKFCANDGKEFAMLEYHETQRPYVWGNSPGAELKFTCTQRAK